MKICHLKKPTTITTAHNHDLNGVLIRESEIAS